MRRLRIDVGTTITITTTTTATAATAHQHLNFSPPVPVCYKHKFSHSCVHCFSDGGGGRGGTEEGGARRAKAVRKRMEVRREGRLTSNLLQLGSPRFFILQSNFNVYLFVHL